MRGKEGAPNSENAVRHQSTKTSMFSSLVKPPISWNQFGCTNQCSVTFGSMPCLPRNDDAVTPAAGPGTASAPANAPARV